MLTSYWASWYNHYKTLLMFPTFRWQKRVVPGWDIFIYRLIVNYWQQQSFLVDWFKVLQPSYTRGNTRGHKLKGLFLLPLKSSCYFIFTFASSPAPILLSVEGQLSFIVCLRARVSFSTSKPDPTCRNERGMSALLSWMLNSKTQLWAPHQESTIRLPFLPSL